jgi:opacity protein-like surface antigen
MKQYAIIAAILCLALAPAAGAQIDQSARTIGFGVDGGLVIPVSGDAAVDSSFSDYFGIGPGFGAHVSYTPIKQVTVRAGFSYAFMKMKDEVAGDAAVEPYLSTPYVYLDGVLNGGGFMKPGSIINPYAIAGGGVYMWKITDDGVNGDARVLGNLEEMKKTSPGLHFGAGLEVFATPQLSVFAEGKYHMVFMEDTEKFGEDFGNLGAIDVSAGLTYRLPL